MISVSLTRTTVLLHADRKTIGARLEEVHLNSSRGDHRGEDLSKEVPELGNVHDHVLGQGDEGLLMGEGLQQLGLGHHPLETEM